MSTKQPVVALSTCESELIATCTIGCAVAWANQFIQELVSQDSRKMVQSKLD